MKKILTCINANFFMGKIIKAFEGNKLNTWEVRPTKDKEKVLTHSTCKPSMGGLSSDSTGSTS